MKKRIALTTTLILIATLVAVPFVQADPQRRGPGRGGELGPLAGLFKAKEELALSDQQVDEIKAIFRDLREQNAPFREQVREGRQSITSALIANPNDVAGAQAVLSQQASAQQALQANTLAATAKALGVLTAEQRTKLASLIAERQQQREARRPH